MRSAFVLLAALLLAGCGDGYPADWPGVDKPWFARCPDLRGTYRIATVDVGARTYSMLMSETPFEPRWRSNSGVRWDVMTVSGDTSERMDLRFTRSAAFDEAVTRLQARNGGRRPGPPQSTSPERRWSESNRRLSDAEFSANVTPQSVPREDHRELQRGIDYDCASGWMVADGSTGDSSLDQVKPIPLADAPTQRFGRDRSGALIEHRTRLVEAKFNVWCGDGCKGFSLGTMTEHGWNRALSIPEPEDASPPPPLRPWLENFAIADPIAITPEGPTAGRLVEARALIAHGLPADVALDSLNPAGRGVRATISARDGDTMRPQFDALSNVKTLTEIKVEAFHRTSPQRAELQLWIALAHLPPRLQREALRLELIKLLPAQTRVENYSVGDARYGLWVEAPNQAEISTLLRSLDGAPPFRSPELLTIEETRTGIKAYITFEDR